MKCGNCGASIVQLPGARFTVCQYCGRQLVFKSVIPDTRQRRIWTKQLWFDSATEEHVMSKIREWEAKGWKLVGLRHEKPSGHSIGRFGIKTVADLQKEVFV